MQIKPHGGQLIRRILQGEERENVLENCCNWISIIVDEETSKDIRNICRGIYSPLNGFLSKIDLSAIIDDSILENGLIWTVPIVLDIDHETAIKLKEGRHVLIKNEDNSPLASMLVEEIYKPDVNKLVSSVFQTNDEKHPGVAGFLSKKEYYVAGRIDLIDTNRQPFPEYNLDPLETRILFREKGWQTVVAFQTRNPVHRSHEYLQKCALEVVDGLFINPVIGKKKSGDFKDEVIIAVYEKMISDFYPKNRAVMSILPMKMNYAGPKEAIFHAIIRQNFGCTHFIVGRDHAGVGKYYGTYDAQKIFEKMPFNKLEIKPLCFENSFFCSTCDQMATSKTCPHGDSERIYLSGSLVREMIIKHISIPEEMTRKEISDIMINYPKPFVE
ncbi:MAG: sulfate adenylyltransferase [Candidatus Coatesbacteria bacterium]|nr:sulfate adenylyltransferase [Candidatus Coatesbacteria bacterium]